MTIANRMPTSFLLDRITQIKTCAKPGDLDDKTFTGGVAFSKSTPAETPVHDWVRATDLARKAINVTALSAPIKARHQSVVDRLCLAVDPKVLTRSRDNYAAHVFGNGFADRLHDIDLLLKEAPFALLNKIHVQDIQGSIDEINELYSEFSLPQSVKNVLDQKFSEVDALLASADSIGMFGVFEALSQLGSNLDLASFSQTVQAQRSFARLKRKVGWVFGGVLTTAFFLNGVHADVVANLQSYGITDPPKYLLEFAEKIRDDAQSRIGHTVVKMLPSPPSDTSQPD
jgi:hypothetical protein